MGKAIGGLPEAAPLTPGGEPEPIGRYLARQRQLRGISLDELAALTHLPRRSLERLEAGAHDRAPDGFARGFVRTVAAAIGLDPEETVARMLAEARPVRRTPARLPAAILLGATLLLLAAVALSQLPGWRSALPHAGHPAERELPRRHDYVRELAERQAAAAPDSATTPDASASPVPVPEVPRAPGAPD